MPQDRTLLNIGARGKEGEESHETRFQETDRQTLKEDIARMLL